METNVVIAVIALSGIVISAICVLGGAIFAYIASNKRLQNVETELKQLYEIKAEIKFMKDTLTIIQNDLRIFYDQIAKIKAHIKLD